MLPDPKTMIERDQIEQNILDRIKWLEDMVTALMQREVRANSVEEISDNLGTMRGEFDSAGVQLAPNGGFDTGDNTGWSSSSIASGSLTWAGTLGYTSGSQNLTARSDRFAVHAGKYFVVQFDMLSSNIGYETDGSPIPELTSAVIEWYDALSGGNLLASEPIGLISARVYGRTFITYPGAVAARLVIAGLPTFHELPGNFLDNVSVLEVDYAAAITLDDPVPTLITNNVNMQITAGKRHFYDPGNRPDWSAVLVSTSTGNLTNGPYYYQIAWIDDFGETLPSQLHYLAVDGTHKQVTITLPRPPAGVGLTRIYRTTSGGSVYKKLVDLPPNATSYTDNIADINLGVDGPADENTTMGCPVLPTFVIWPIHLMDSNTTLTRVANSTQLHGEYWEAAGNGNWLKPQGVLLPRGRTRFKTIGSKNPGNGLLDYYMDGQTIYTGQDWYASSQQLNQIMTFDFFIDQPGWHEFLIQVNGKNASASANYYFRLTEMSANFISR